MNIISRNTLFAHTNKQKQEAEKRLKKKKITLSFSIFSRIPFTYLLFISSFTHATSAQTLLCSNTITHPWRTPRSIVESV